MNDELLAWKSSGQYFNYLGFNIFFRVYGSGPPLLLIHGYPFSSYDWAPIWPALTKRFTVIAPDMLGMGFSDKPSRYHYHVLDHADMHESLLAELRVDRCHVVAHDIGVSVLQELLARQAARHTPGAAFEIDSVTWLNGGLFNETYRPRLIQTLMSQTPLGRLAAWLPPFLTKAAINELFGDTKPTPQLHRQLHEILSYNDGKRVSHQVGRFINDRRIHRNRWVRAMQQTQVPMRFINGPADPNSGRHMALRYAEVIADPDIVVLDDGVGHWPQIEAPDDLVDSMIDHLDRVLATAPHPNPEHSAR